MFHTPAHKSLGNVRNVNFFKVECLHCDGRWHEAGALWTVDGYPRFATEAEARDAADAAYPDSGFAGLVRIRPVVVSYQRVSPIDLKVGDRVLEHGAIMKVMHITERPTETKGGIRVAACTSRLVGDDNGAIPRGWFDSRRTLIERGCTWAKDLPEGRYWNVQGNALATAYRVIA